MSVVGTRMTRKTTPNWATAKASERGMEYEVDPQEERRRGLDERNRGEGGEADRRARRPRRRAGAASACGTNRPPSSPPSARPSMKAASIVERA